MEAKHMLFWSYKQWFRKLNSVHFHGTILYHRTFHFRPLSATSCADSTLVVPNKYTPNLLQCRAISKYENLARESEKMVNEPNYYPNFDASTWQRSCTEEIITPIQGKVSGHIPEWLNGVLIRNGPGLFEIGDTAFKHVFDGMALLHRCEIKNGVVTYQCRFLQSNMYKKNKAASRIVVTDFGTESVPDPCQSIFSRLTSTFNFNRDIPDNAVISVYPFGDEVYSFAESGTIYRVKTDNLETKTKINFRKSLGIVTHTAHPHVVEDGTVYNLALSYAKKGLNYHIVCFPSKPKKDMNDYSMFDKAHVVANVPARSPLQPSYMHSFGITEHYFIIIEQPMSIVLSKLLGVTFFNKPSRSLIKWHENKTTKFNVVSRQTGKLVYTFQSKGFLFFHTINQYEDSNHIVLDICTFPDGSALDAMYIDAINNAHKNPDYGKMIQSRPHRFILPLHEETDNTFVNKNLIKIPNTSAKAWLKKDGTIFVEPEQISDTICDMPTVSYNNFSGKKYRYFYGVSPCTVPVNPAAVIKVNVENKTSIVWSEEGCYPSEPIFVPSPNSQSEDDGVILTSVIYGKNKYCAGLVVLDAKTFKEMGRALFSTPSPVPRTFHGWYFANP